MVCLCNLAFAKHVPSADAGQLIGDPTTCYQSPERLRACHSHTAAIERGAGRGAGASLGAGAGADAGTGLAGGGGGGGSSSSSSSNGSSVILRRDEVPSNLYGGDIFSAGVSLFILVAHEAILTRLVTEATCEAMGSGGDGGQSSGLPALNVFQRAAGGGMSGLLQARVPMGGMQRRLWAYWEVYGLQLPPSLRGLLDGMPDLRFSMQHVFPWMDCTPYMFVVQV